MDSLKISKLNFHKFIETLIIIIPLFLITGPFLTDLAFSIVALYFFFKYRKIDNSIYLVNYFFYIFLFFWAVILISSILAVDRNLSLSNTFFYFRFFLFSICFLYILNNNENLIKKLFYVLLFCYSILFFDSIFQSYFKINLIGMPINQEYEGRRISSFFGDELVLGSYIARLSPLIMGIFFYLSSKKKFINENYFIIFLFFSEIAIFLSGERTALLLYNFFIVLLVIFINDYKRLKIKIIFIFISSLVLLFSLDIPSKKRILDETLRHLKPENYNSKYVIINKQYHEHFISSFRIFKDNKLIGVGPKNFRIVCHEKKYNLSKITCSTHPHNTYLQLLSETGIFGFLTVFIIFLTLVYFLLKNYILSVNGKKLIFDNLEICLILHFIISLFPLTTSGNFFNNWISIIYFYPVGILVWSLGKKK